MVLWRPQNLLELTPKKGVLFIIRDWNKCKSRKLRDSRRLFVLLSLLQTWWTCQKPSGLCVRSVGSTSPAKWHSTRRAGILYMLRESGIMTGSRVAVGQTKLIFRKKAKSTKKIVLRLEYVEPNCRSKRMLTIKRCKHFQLGGNRKRKSQVIQFWASYFVLLWRQ